MIASVIMFYLMYTLLLALFDSEELFSHWLGKVATVIAFPGLLLMGKIKRTPSRTEIYEDR